MTYEQARQAREQIEERFRVATANAPELVAFSNYHETEAGRNAAAISASLARAIHAEYRATR